MVDDKTLIDAYLWGFTDELEGIKSTSIKDPLCIKAYRLGHDHAIIGDDVRSADYLTTEEILNMIKNGSSEDTN